MIAEGISRFLRSAATITVSLGVLSGALHRTKRHTPTVRSHGLLQSARAIR